MRRGFALREVVVALVILGVLVVLARVLVRYSRHKEREQWCESGLRQLAIGCSNYATDYGDAIFSFSARAGTKPMEPDVFAPAATDLAAVQGQLAGILHYHAAQDKVTSAGGCLPNVKYAPLVLQDYMQTRLPMDLGVCPEDAKRLAMLPQAAPGSIYGKGGTVLPIPFPEVADPALRRWAYSSSLDVVPASFSPDEATPTSTTIAQGATDGEYLVPKSNPFGTSMRKLAEITFPGQKVGAFDSHDRHYASKPKFYADPSARQPLMFYDMSVRVYRTSETDAGFQPNLPGDPGPTVFDYDPEGEAKNWYPPPVNPGGDRGYKGYYRWTRGGLKGRDVGGAVPGAASGGTSVPSPGLFELVFR